MALLNKLQFDFKNFFGIFYLKYSKTKIGKTIIEIEIKFKFQKGDFPKYLILKNRRCSYRIWNAFNGYVNVYESK